MIEVENVQELAEFIDKELICTSPCVVTKEQLSGFLHICGDTNPIHRAVAGEEAIIPGNLLLVLVPHYVQKTFKVLSCKNVMTVGYRNIKFRAPVHIADRLLVVVTITRIRKLKNQVFLEYTVVMRAEGTGVDCVSLSMTDIYRIT